MRKKVFQRYFLEINTQEQIRKELGISKGSVTKIIKECRDQIAKCELSDEDDLGPFIDRIVEAPMRKKVEYRRKVVTEIHVRIIEKMVVVNEQKKKRLRQNRGYSRSDLYWNFKSVLEKYNMALHNMQHEKNKKISAEFGSEAYQEEEQSYLSHYDFFAKICDEYELPTDFEEPRDRVLHVISPDTFYKLARTAKKTLNLVSVKPKIEEQVDIEEKPECGENINEISEDRPLVFSSEMERVLYELEHIKSAHYKKK
jgi:hypothetical protein